MSAQTIIHPTIASIRKESEDSFIGNAKKLLFQDDYALGDGYCSFEQADAAMIYDIIKSNNCKLLNLIKIEIDRVEDKDPEKRDPLDMLSTSNQNLYELWLSRGNVGTMEDFLNLILADEKANWDEINW